MSFKDNSQAVETPLSHLENINHIVNHETLFLKGMVDPCGVLFNDVECVAGMPLLGTCVESEQEKGTEQADPSDIIRHNFKK